MNWTEERLTTALHSLDTIEADDAFWNHLHAQLHDGPSGGEIAFRADVDTPRRRGRTLLAVAACLVIVAGIAVAVKRADQEAANPGPLHLQIVDALAITLDDLPRTAPPSAPLPGGYLVLDHASLPAGWAVSDEWGGVMSAGPDGIYWYQVTLTAAGDDYTLTVSNVPFGDPPGDPVDVDGMEGFLDASSIRWNLDEGVMATLGPIDAEVAVGVASTLSFNPVDEMPFKEILPTDGPPMSDPALAGRLNGIQWSLFLTDGDDPGRWLYAGRELAAGVGIDPNSVLGPEVDVTGVPGYGSVVWGSVPKEVRSVRVRLVDGSEMTVPVARTDADAYFAVPVPTGLDIDIVEFLGESGVAIAHCEMPDIAAGFGGGMQLEWRRT